MEKVNYIVIMKYFHREVSLLVLASKNDFCATNGNGFQCKLLPQIDSS